MFPKCYCLTESYVLVFIPFIALTQRSSRRRQKCQPLQDAMGSWDAGMNWLRLSMQPLCTRDTPEAGAPHVFVTQGQWLLKRCFLGMLIHLKPYFAFDS